MRKQLFWIVIPALLSATEPQAQQLNVKEACVLTDSAPFHEARENAVFSLSLPDRNLIDSVDSIQNVYVWADGKSYLIDSNDAQTHRSDTQKRVGQLYRNELKSILGSGFVKLRIQYKEQVKEEQSSSGTSAYFTTIRTTVSKEQYLPLALDREEINSAFAACEDSLAAQKKTQTLYEILLGAAAVTIVIGMIVALRRYRRSEE